VIHNLIPGYRVPSTLTKEDLELAISKGFDRKQTAEFYGVLHPENITRQARRLGVAWPSRNKRTPLSLAGRRRARQLLREGMPANWVAEDLDSDGTTTRALALTVDGHAESVLEWRRAWAFIRHKPELLELHYQFAPKGSQYR